MGLAALVVSETTYSDKPALEIVLIECKDAAVDLVDLFDLFAFFISRVRLSAQLQDV